MAKKKKIDIASNPLQSVTIGRTDKKKHGWIGSVILFVLFILIIYFLPDIQKAYKEYLYNKAFNNNTINNTIPTDDNIENNTTSENTINEVLYDINNENQIEINDTTFTNIKFDAGNISFIINNNGDTDINLTEKGYFMKLYDENSYLQKIIKINENVNSKSSKSISYKLDIIPSKYLIVQINEEDYDLIMLTVDSENKSSLTCNNEIETLIYYFQNDKLYRLEDHIKYSKINSDYESMYNKYYSYVVSYNIENGISTSISSNENEFAYSFSIDYNQFTKNIDNIYYYKKDVSPIKINYEMKAMDFDCK
ncbi:MAG: hypothetical protein ACI4XR_04885 [Bacilli bacterium]